MKIFFRLFIFVSLVQSVQAQETETVNSIFWEISGNEISKPSYLFGTHHLHDYKFIEKDANIQNVLKDVDAVIGEIVIDTNMFKIAMKLAAVMRMKDNTLDKLLSPEDYKATDKCLKENMGMGLISLNNIKPIFVYQIIMVAKFMKAYEKERGSTVQSLENPMGNSMDAYFQQQGKKLKKEIKGLETVDDQLKVLYEDYPIQRQVEMLLDIVYERTGSATEDLMQLSKLYNTQNLSELLTIMQKSTKEDELQFLLINRNKAWIPQLDTLFKSKKSAFIAVGAGHLPGSFGIIQLLKDKGYTLKPVSVKVE